MPWQRYFASMPAMDGRDEIADAISEQAHKFAYFRTFGGNAHEQQIKLGERLIHILPGNMSKVLFASSGSEANDANVKMAWMYQFLRGKPEKRKIIARHMGYHGVITVGASLSGLPLMHAPFGLPLPGFLHTDKGHYYWEGQPGESERDFSKRMAANLDAQIVAVMATGMHLAVIGGAMRKVIGFVNKQRIHIRTETNGLVRRSDLQCADHAGTAQTTIHIEAKGAQI
jgi:adenosylmethionine-8-amino-7-oxononanoate aminotransferase